MKDTAFPFDQADDFFDRFQAEEEADILIPENSILKGNEMDRSEMRRKQLLHPSVVMKTYTKGCPDCERGAWIPHGNCLYYNWEMTPVGHSKTHCTADACY